MPVTEIEIGRAKRGRRVYSLDDVALVPSRRTRDPRDVSTDWQIDAFSFPTPILGAPMASVMSPETAIALGRLGGLGVLNLEGLWTRYESPEPLLAEIAGLDPAAQIAVMRLFRDLAGQGRTLGDVDRFICHPGGMKVIDALESSLTLEVGSLDHERAVLRDHGNMSAPTVLHVLDRARRAGLPPCSVVLALGPGFTCSTVTLEALA